MAILLVAGGCKPEEPDPIPDPTDPGKVVHVYCKGQVCEVESIDPNGTVVLINLPKERQPRKDDIIVSYPTEIAPYGFLYKVKTVSTSGGKTTVTTEPASIEEAVENAIINKTIHLNEFERIEINQIVPFDGGVSAKLDGTIEIKMTASFDLTIEDWCLKYMKFTVTPEIISKITLDFEGKIQAEQRINIAKVRYEPVITMVGVVPIVLVPEVAVDVLVDMDGAAKIMATLVDASYQSVYGVEYKNGKYSAIDENKSQPAKYLDSVSLLLDGEIKVQPQLSVGFMFFDVTSVSLNGSMPVNLTTDELKKNSLVIYGLEEENPQMRLSLGLEFELDLKSKILSKNLSDCNTKFTTHNWPIWERKIFPEFENLRISNQDASSRIVTVGVKGWSLMFSTDQHGFCWGTASLPTINDNKKEFGKLELLDGSTSIETTISNLESNTIYYVRPFFENYFGVFYGQETSFSLGSPEITLDPASLPFGDVVTNTKMQRQIIVRNTGDETLKISSITSSDPAFSVSSTEFTLLSNKEYILFVTFSPAQERSYSGTLTILSNAAEKTKTVPLTGMGVPTPSPVITLNPASLSFGDVAINTSETQQISVKNTGDETLKISSITSSDPAFSVSSTEFTLLPNKEFILFVTFSPAQERSYSGTLTIQSNAAEKTKTVALTGKGVAPPSPVITLNPASLSFGDVAINTSETQQISVKNTGDETLKISSITSSDPAFSVSSNEFTLLPNKEYILFVTFSPTQERSYSGMLTIQSNTAEKTKTVPLTGMGIELQIVSIKNPSVETGNSNNTLPANWSTNYWGSLTAKFTYLLTEGHTGNRSVRVDVTGYVSGDAKWMFEAVQLEPGGDYIFSDWYKSNVDTEVVLAVTNTAGQQVYYDLPFVPKSAVWAKYEAPFTMPKNGVKATVYHILKHNGYLITDDYQIAHYKYKGFDHGMVTITFDDAWEENPETALPVMKQYGFKSTQYYATTYIKDTPWQPHPWPKQQIQKFIDAGHEIGSHTVTHPWLTTLTEQNLIRELVDSKQYLENFLGIPIRHFASSYGDYNTFVKDKIMEYYDTHRTVDAGYNSKDNLDYSKLKNMCVLLTTTIGEFEEWVKKARDEKLWLILLYHRVGGKEAPTENDTTPQKFSQQMKLLYDYGIEVVTISEALEIIKNQ